MASMEREMTTESPVAAQEVYSSRQERSPNRQRSTSPGSGRRPPKHHPGLPPSGHGHPHHLRAQRGHRRPAMGSALSALTFDRTPTQVDGRQSCWATSQRSSSSPTVRNGATRRMDRYTAN